MQQGWLLPRLGSIRPTISPAACCRPRGASTDSAGTDLARTVSSAQDFRQQTRIPAASSRSADLEGGIEDDSSLPLKPLRCILWCSVLLLQPVPHVDGLHARPDKAHMAGRCVPFCNISVNNINHAGCRSRRAPHILRLNTVAHRRTASTVLQGTHGAQNKLWHGMLVHRRALPSAMPVSGQGAHSSI